MLATSRIPHHRTWLILAWAIAVTALGTGIAMACSVPVFRYALERWEPDAYSVLIFHRGPKDGATEKVVEHLLAAASDQTTPANVAVKTIDLDGEMPPMVQAIWQRHSAQPLPWMVVRYPHSPSESPDAWAGPVSADVAQQLLDSPARREIARRLLGGESAVWLLLESGHKDLDDAAVALIDKQLAGLEKTLKLPELSTVDQEIIGDERPELKIKFSMLRLSRSDTAESLTVKMLLGTESDLATFDKPMVFPVFGRGRAYFALVGDGIDQKNIQEIGVFLTGQCSCEVKLQNPGTDLLMTANWGDQHGKPVAKETIPTSVPIPPKRADASPPPAVSPAPATLLGGASWRNMLLVGGAVILVVFVASGWLVFKRKFMTQGST